MASSASLSFSQTMTLRTRTRTSSRCTSGPTSRRATTSPNESSRSAKRRARLMMSFARSRRSSSTLCDRRRRDMEALEQIDVRTHRLHLRPPRESDADRLYALFNNWEVMRWLSSPPWPYALDDARAFVRSRASGERGAIGGAITLDGELIGIADVVIKPASAVQRESGYSLGYW